MHVIISRDITNLDKLYVTNRTFQTNRNAVYYCHHVTGLLGHVLDVEGSILGKGREACYVHNRLKQSLIQWVSEVFFQRKKLSQSEVYSSHLSDDEFKNA